MEITEINNEHTGLFVAMDNDAKAGQLNFRWKSKEVFSIDHTEVDDQYAGKGVGKALVYYAIDYARKNHLRIIVRCAFAKKIFDTHEEFRDVLV